MQQIDGHICFLQMNDAIKRYREKALGTIALDCKDIVDLHDVVGELGKWELVGAVMLLMYT